MKLALMIGLLFFYGCASTMVQDVSAVPAYAPKGYQQKGTVKYLNAGADFIIRKRREDAFKQMHNACGGNYEIIHEGPKTQKITQGWGALNVSGGDEIFIDFQCVAKK